jgi:hypothetical protein
VGLKFFGPDEKQEKQVAGEEALGKHLSSKAICAVCVPGRLMQPVCVLLQAAASSKRASRDGAAAAAAGKQPQEQQLDVVLFFGIIDFLQVRMLQCPVSIINLTHFLQNLAKKQYSQRVVGRAVCMQWLRVHMHWLRTYAAKV